MGNSARRDVSSSLSALSFRTALPYITRQLLKWGGRKQVREGGARPRRRLHRTLWEVLVCPMFVLELVTFQCREQAPRPPVHARACVQDRL